MPRLFLVVRPGEAPPEDAFDDQVIGGRGCADADSEVELPLRPQIEVNGRNELLLLIVEWTEIRDRPPGTVVFQPSGNSLGDVVTEFEVWREDHALVNARPVKRAVERGIKAQIPTADFFVHDRADL